MIISTNREPNLDEFKELIDAVTLKLNDDATKRTPYYLTRNAQLLEDDVLKLLVKTAIGTKFEGTIEKISGQRFPDIVAGKYYGVEVKSSKDEKWITLGGSVNESTRVEDVERIFLVFGKLMEPIEFRSRPYEDCLFDVVVTHYPRYKINMNLKQGETIFDKMGTTYDKLRESDNPVGKVIDYYKSQLSHGESLWWTGNVIKDEQPKEMPMKIRLCKYLSADERLNLKLTGLVLFPELTKFSSTKYGRFSLWLVANHSVVSTSIRDLFSAGGQGFIKSNNRTYKNIPRIIMNISENKNSIKKIIKNTEESILCETWNVENIETDRLGQWINLISKNCKLKDNDIRLVMKTIFNRK
jgi:hypothetical protein